MSLIKFSEFDEESLLYGDDIVIVEWSLEEWRKLLNYERAELDEEEEEALKEYQAKNTMQRRSMQRNKDRNKFKDKQKKRLDKIERNKGGNKVKRKKLRGKWMRVNKAKIANAQKVYGNKVHSKFTKKK